MTPRPLTPETRSFSVHAGHLDRHHARVVREPSFEAAAVAYAEDLHAVGADEALRIVVRDLENGHEHCFHIDLTTGETAPCG